MSFMAEGVKIIFRYTYAVMKYYKHFIKSIKDPKELVENLKNEAKTNTDPSKLRKIAYRYPLRTKHCDMNEPPLENIDGKDVGGSEFSEYVPIGGSKSTIVSYEELAKIWGMLPQFVKVRKPELLYSTHTDGFNI